MDEETDLAKSAVVDLNKLFKDLKFSSGEELALSAGQPLSKACPNAKLRACIVQLLVEDSDNAER